MMWFEFENLAGYHVTYEDYHNIIEPMYTATNLSKKDFIECLDYKRFSIEHRKEKIIKELKKEAKEMKAECGHVWNWGHYETMEKLVREYAKLSNLDKDYSWEFEYGEIPFTGGCKYITNVVFIHNHIWSIKAERITLTA